MNYNHAVHLFFDGVLLFLLLDMNVKAALKYGRMRVEGDLHAFTSKAIAAFVFALLLFMLVLQATSILSLILWGFK